MNTKIGFLLLLVLLIILMLFYYIDLESNIIILLAVVIVLVIHNLITKKEHFSIKDSAVALDSKLDTLLSIAQALKRTPSTNTADSSDIASLPLESSCPFAANGNTENIDVLEFDAAEKNMFNLGGARQFTSIGNLTEEDLRDKIVKQ
jgi:hypothetical protein